MEHNLFLFYGSSSCLLFHNFEAAYGGETDRTASITSKTDRASRVLPVCFDCNMATSERVTLEKFEYIDRIDSDDVRVEIMGFLSFPDIQLLLCVTKEKRWTKV